MPIDIWTIIWRDVRLYRAQYEDPRRLAIGLAISLAFIIAAQITFDVHRHLSSAHPFLLVWVWCWLPLGSAVTLSTDAIAGERERHTLESLLASRIPTRALLIGKTLSITVQSWLSALSLAFGALIAINLVTIWQGTIALFPVSVMIAGPVVSFLLTLLGTLAALLLSMDAATVRQANFRILIVTSLLPILLIVPVAILLVFSVLIIAIFARYFGFGFPDVAFPLDPVVIVVATGVALVGLFVCIAATYAVTALRFTRERLLKASAGANKDPEAEPLRLQQAGWFANYGTGRTVASPSSATAASEGPLIVSASSYREKLKSILQDAAIVAWKEVIEARGLVREWRGWLIVVLFVLATMLVQLSVIGSWYWSRDADSSLLFWLAMAAALPILIAQRSSDAIAGERERHTGEILFTTRLSHSGILLGKLGATALLPWCVALVIPAVGLASINLIHAETGPYWYPFDVLLAGTGLTLGMAILLAAGGLFVSLGAPTVQHAARRISWFLMPMLILPGLLLRGSSWPDTDAAATSLESSGVFGLAASGELAIYILISLPLIAVASAGIVLVLIRRFQRGATVFD
ncbi:MAG: ABC transporter permease subunit [Thermomicrobiales bacterium]